MHPRGKYSSIVRQYEILILGKFDNEARPTRNNHKQDKILMCGQGSTNEHRLQADLPCPLETASRNKLWNNTKR